MLFRSRGTHHSPHKAAGPMGPRWSCAAAARVSWRCSDSGDGLLTTPLPEDRSAARVSSDGGRGKVRGNLALLSPRLIIYQLPPRRTGSSISRLALHAWRFTSWQREGHSRRHKRSSRTVRLLFDYPELTIPRDSWSYSPYLQIYRDA